MMFLSRQRQNLFNRILHKSPARNLVRLTSRDFRAAVVFHGNGVYDGTECTEAVAMLVGLSRLGAEVQVFAPDRP